MSKRTSALANSDLFALPDMFLQVLYSGQFLCAVYRKFAVNASASEGVMKKPSGEEPFSASWTREHVVADSGNRKKQHPRDGKHKDWFVGVEELLGQDAKRKCYGDVTDECKQ